MEFNVHSKRDNLSSREVTDTPIWFEYIDLKQIWEAFKTVLGNKIHVSVKNLMIKNIKI
jgi:hypothetical protein